MSRGDKEAEELELDRQHFIKTLASFKFYGIHLGKKIEKSRAYFKSLSTEHQTLVPEFKNKLDKIESCVNHNSGLLDTIIQNSAPDIFGGEHSSDLQALSEAASMSKHQSHETKTTRMSHGTRIGPFAFTTTDMDKVRSTLKQFARDWSEVGAKERAICYKPVIDEVVELFKHVSDPVDVKILVPGAGLGRLAWEFAHRGFACQGNEWSLHMLIPAYFILNTCRVVNEYTIYPWVSQFCNNMIQSDQLVPVPFPDVAPCDLPPNVPFCMAAGDFVEVYKEPNSWDCITTVFFIDTAHNILQYLESIWLILKPGGYWINFGPLLYHFSDIPGEDSLELSYDELRLAIDRMGFETLKEKTGIRCGYTQNSASMLSYEYSCVYGLFRKPLS
ncbi:Carnosine N-methyltransferase [Fasciolopsis buskii]|uniref:carnosine N-methyltransferase n=1 Tax=Fasciolopsis buskii TaxID=27845 RepID=A0A8E0VIB6_9TREM|nr:Carnosine N-methyltransferase [Fasciolopsis buski]